MTITVYLFANVESLCFPNTMLPSVQWVVANQSKSKCYSQVWFGQSVDTS